MHIPIHMNDIYIYMCVCMHTLILIISTWFFSSKTISPLEPLPDPQGPRLGPGYNVAISACAGRAFELAQGLFQEMLGATGRNLLRGL